MTSQVYVVRILGSLLLSMGGCSLLFGVLSQRECAEEESEDSCEGNTLITCRGDQLFEIDCTGITGSTCDPINNVCTVCGDGFLSVGETCDDGNSLDDDSCRNDCTPQVCGDGVIATIEACDDGNTQDNDCCSNVCFPLVPNCELESNDTLQSTDDFFALAPDSFRQAFLSGNGDVDIFTLSFTRDVFLSASFVGLIGCSEELDIKLAIRSSSGDLIAQSPLFPCSALLDKQLPAGDYFVEITAAPFTGPDLLYFLSITACGDGAEQPAVNGFPGELCDDGNQISGDGCRNDCRGEEKCGDSFNDLSAGEGCDDGGFVGSDGCDQTCQLETGFIAEVEPNDSPAEANTLGSVGAVGLGDGFTNDFFRLQLNNTASIQATLSPRAGLSCPGVFGGSSELVLLDSQGSILARDFLFLQGDQFCNLIDPKEQHAARALPAGDYFVSVFMPFAYSLRVEVFPCGDTILQPGEECEPPGGAGCDALCQRVPVCGDGFRDAPEACDDGNQTSGDSCDQSCQKEAALEVESNHDGEVNVGGVAQGNDFTEINAQPLISFPLDNDALLLGAISPAGDEDVFRVLPPGPGRNLRIDIFDAALGIGQPCGPNLDTFLAVVLPGSGGAPTRVNDNRGPNDFCSGTFVFGDEFGSIELADTFFIHIFAPSDDQELPPYLLVLDYIQCGDGILDFSEECDPPGTDCDIVCQLGPVCGDGFREGAEICDDGNLTNGDGCNTLCQIEFIDDAEPNEDGFISIGGDPLNGNDFSTPNAGTPISIDRTVQAAISPAGDEDVFAIQNSTASPVSVRLDTFDPNFGTNFCPAMAVNTVLSIRDATGALLAQNDDRADIMGSEPCSGLNVLLGPNQTAFAHVIAFGDNALIPGYFLVVNFP